MVWVGGSALTREERWALALKAKASNLSAFRGLGTMRFE
jgi:hypothetical protein